MTEDEAFGLDDLPRVQLGPPGRYQLPPIMKVVNAAAPLDKRPVRIRARLATGHELDIPVIPESIAPLMKLLSVHLPTDFLQEMVDYLQSAIEQDKRYRRQ